MKKLLSVLLATVMALVICSADAFAAEKPTFTLTTKDKFNSGNVTVGVSVKNLTANALTIEVSFDTDIVAATGSSILQRISSYAIINNKENANKRGIFRYDMFDGNDISFEDGALLSLTFSVKDYSAFDESTIKISKVVVGTDKGEITDYSIVNNNKVDHQHDDVSETWTVTEAATCEKEGVRVKYCKVCGEIAEREVIPSSGHKWDSGVVTRAATCTADGVITYTCLSNKAHTKTETIEATGHDFSEWKEGSNGQEIRVCKNDNKHTQIKDKGSSDPIVNERPVNSEETLGSEEDTSFSSSDTGSYTVSSDVGSSSGGEVSSEDIYGTGSNISSDGSSDEGIPTVLIVILAGAAVLGVVLFIIKKRRF